MGSRRTSVPSPVDCDRQLAVEGSDPVGEAAQARARAGSAPPIPSSQTSTRRRPSCERTRTGPSTAPA